MQKWYLPVVYQLYGTVEVEAETLEDAIKTFNNQSYEVELPEGEYVPDSFVLCNEGEIENARFHHEQHVLHESKLRKDAIL